MEHAEIEQEILEQSISVCPEVDVIRGIDGFSPIANVERVEHGARITVTDKTGTTTTVVMDGQKGEKGDKGDSGDYNELANKPSINNVELVGNKSISDLGLASKAELTSFRDEYDSFTEEISTAIENETEAREQAVSAEETARINADAGLQEQIDGITASSDVKDIVGTKEELDAYDKSTLGNNDIIKVISDSTHEDAMSYYRYDSATNAFVYIGKEGPFYTKAESDAEFAKATDLSSYVKKTDYATGSEAGVIKTSGSDYFTAMTGGGKLYATTATYDKYQANNGSMFMSKGTTENLLTARKYLMPEYTQTLPQTGAENKLYLVPTAEQPDVLNQTEGKEITLTDSSEGNLEWGEIKGETSQQTTSGKNLLKLANLNKTLNGVTCTYDDSEQTLTFNGTCTDDNTVFMFANNSVQFTSGKTRASAHYVSGSVTTYCAVRFFDSTYAGTNFVILTLSASNPIISSLADKTYSLDPSKASIRFNTGSVANNFKIKLMVADTNDTTFEPYTAGASPNPTYPQEVKTVTGKNEIVVSGKNLAWDGWAEDFVARVNSSIHAGLETVDGKECVRWKENTGYQDYDHRYIFKPEDGFKENTRYTVSMDLKPSSNFSCIRLAYSDGTSGGFKTDLTANTWQHVTMTSLAGKTIKYISVQYNAGTIYMDLDTFMVEESTSATTYEPYRKQSVEVNLGKNLFELANTYVFENLTWGTTSYQILESINTLENGTYTLSADFEITATDSNPPQTPAKGFYIEKPDGNIINRTNWSSTAVGTKERMTLSFTINDTNRGSFSRVYMYGFAPTGTGRAKVSNVQIEKGSATEFAPYFTPIELCKIGTHQDRIYKDSEGWKLHKEVGKKVWDGSEGWGSSGAGVTGNIKAFVSTGGLPLAKNWSEGYCDRFVAIEEEEWSQDYYKGSADCTTTNGNMYIRISGDLASSPATFKTWLASNPTTYYYQLITPTDTLITNSALIEQLENLNTLTTGQGYNLISTDTEHEVPTLKFSYYRPDPTVTKDEYIWVENHYEQLGGHRKFAHNLSVNHHTAQGHWQYSFQITTDTHTHFTHLYQVAKYIADNHAGLVLPISGTYTEGNDIYFITKLEGYSSSQVAIEMRKLSDGSLRRITTGAVDVIDYVS